MSKFIIDTNVLLEAHKRNYRFNFCPGFWDFLASCYRDKMICSIDRVDKEIIAEPVRKWIETELDADFFEPTVTIPEISEDYGNILNWVKNRGYYSPARVAEFAKGADGWLVAYAKKMGYTVVTDEGFDLNAKKKVFLPVVCHFFGVKSTRTCDFLESQGAKFISTGTR